MWTAGLAIERPEGLTAAFAAVVASDRRRACEAIGRVLGAAVDPSRVSRGLDLADPYAELLVTERLAGEMRTIESGLASGGVRTYQVRLERAFR